MGDMRASIEQSHGLRHRSVALHPRLAWILAYEQTRNVRAVCEKFKISRKTFYKWLRRFEESQGNTASLADRSRRPHHFPRATPTRDIALLQKAKHDTGFGQRRLKSYIEQKYKISLSERTIWKILKQSQEGSPKGR